MSDEGFHPIWTRSKWKYGDLQDKIVEFELPLKKGVGVRGIGKFLISQNPEGLLFVQIRVDLQGRNWAERIVQDFQLPQAAVDRIEGHPDQSVAQFRLI